MDIAGKVFIVTGGASGLGEGTARMLTAKGAKVVIAPGAPCTAQHGEFARQAPLAKQFKQGRNQLPVREVTTGAEDHQTLGWHHPLLAKADPKWIGEHGAHGAFSVPPGLTGLTPWPKELKVL